MPISLATSLHLDHGSRALDYRGGDPLTMQAFVPIGLLSLKAACDAGHVTEAVRVTELNTLINSGEIPNDDDFYDNIAQTVLKGGADIVGLMTDADSLHHTLAFAMRVKDRAPYTCLGLGGPAVSPIASRILERFPAVDFIVRGEGEVTFPEFVSALKTGGPFGDIPGLTWREGGVIHHNPDRSVIEDLDLLPIPDFAAYAANTEAALYLDVGRGCPFKCAFCATAPFWKRRYRMKSIQRILQEMQILRQLWGRTHFNYSHDIFTYDATWTHRFCAAMIAANLGVTWTCSTRTDVIQPELLQHMADAGCVEIYYGIETGSQDLQKVINKNLDLSVSREIIKATRAVGIRPVTGFIIGHPEETEHTLSDTVACFFDFLQIGGYRAHMFTLCPFPGAPMFTRSSLVLERRAEYLDLPVTDTIAAKGQELVDRDPDIFASQYRFKAPGLPSSLVDATEEISPHLVLLKRVWPLLLPHYDKAVTFFTRWTAWIARRNHQRPWRARHHGNALDLIDFFVEEQEWFGIVDGRLQDLIRYESLKIQAGGLPITRSETGDPVAHTSLTERTWHALPFLIAAFDCDIGCLVSGRWPRDHEGNIGRQWVVFAREPAGTINIHAVSEAAHRVLEHAKVPRSMDELVRVALADGPIAEPQEFTHGLEIVKALTTSRLLYQS